MCGLAKATNLEFMTFLLAREGFKTQSHVVWSNQAEGATVLTWTHMMLCATENSEHCVNREFRPEMFYAHRRVVAVN